MPTGVYTQRLVKARLATPGEWDIYTLPETGRWIVRDIVWANVGAAPADVRLSTRAGTSGTRFVLDSAAQLAAATSRHVDLRQEVMPGETLSMYTNASDVSLLVTAYHFTTP